jgi:hypothetical protein
MHVVTGLSMGKRTTYNVQRKTYFTGFLAAFSLLLAALGHLLF